MGNPQMSDRMKLGPTDALRAVFTGIGRIVMSADRTQERPAREGGDQRRQAAAASGRAAGRPGGRRARGQTAPVSRWRSLDETGNVRLLSAEDLDDGDSAARPLATETPLTAEPPVLAETVQAETPVPAETPLAAEPAPAAETPLAAEPAPAAETPLAAEAAPAAETPGLAESAGLPLASYDTLSLASIRARLRNLDAGQLRVLAGYERTHAERVDVLGMLERRIEKLETGR
jgi:hypothetical protein